MLNSNINMFWTNTPIVYKMTVFHPPHNFSNIGRDEVTNELLHVIVDGSPFFNSGHNGREIVVCQYHFRGGFRNSRSRAHGNADFCFFQCRSIIDAITSLKNKTRTVVRFKISDSSAVDY